MPPKKSRKPKNENMLGVKPIEIITGAKLPSRGQALGRMYYLITTKQKAVLAAAREVYQEIAEIWAQCDIKTKSFCNGAKFLKKFYEEWKNLRRNMKRTSVKLKINTFRSKLNDLLDIAHNKAMEQLDEDGKKFLCNQRKAGRVGSFGRTVRDTEERADEQADNDELMAIPSVVSVAEPVLDSASASTICSYALPPPKKQIMTPHLAATLDRVGLSDRNAMYVISAVLQSAGLSLDEFSLNRETIRQSRQTFRQNIATELKANFDVTGIVVVHWDGKLLRDLTGRQNVDRLPVLISAERDVQLLGVPKLYEGTGANQATAVFDNLYEWGLDGRVKAMGFDTTYANTGATRGACVLLEQKLNRELLWLACRHHVLELLMKVAWKFYFTSTSPTNALFNKFQKQWPSIDKTYVDEMIDSDLIECLGDDCKEILEMVSNQLKRKQIRDDYKELLLLAKMALGKQQS